MNTIEQFEVGGSHREVGLAIGRRFADKIHRLFDNYDFLQERLLPFHRSRAGRGFYRSFLELHRARFAGYVAELEGIARGAERPFEEIFLVNLRGEYGGLMALERQVEDAPENDGRGCTDCLVLTPDAALIGHNEDGTPAALGNMFVVRAKVGENPAFTAFCYPGFLPGNAFGFNGAGLMHTINAVSPRQVRVGLARHFIARSLFDARSLDDAIRRATVAGRAAGFTYNIGSLAERCMVSVEVAPERHHVHEVQGYYLHTNHYRNLSDVDQGIGPSSRTRLARGRTLCKATPPADAAHVLALLGDQADRNYPIYRRATPPDRGATLCSALFDLDARQLRIYAGHPVLEPEQSIVFDL
jgi:hypothetical protein